jgi:DivIVA domain-containing protein
MGVPMDESDRRQRVISSTPRLSIDEVASRTFAKGVRGFSESEVRSFLRRVSDELALTRAREQELESAIDALEEQVRTPRPLSEQELLDALGEETARLLRSAREASDDIRKKAEERAARLVEEAAATAERTRAEATELFESRTEEAEANTAELVSAAETRAMAALEAAKAEAETILDHARRQGREMLDEAKSARERVLGDLVRRRSLLNGQIEALRTGRDHLLDAYRTVKGTFLDATEALAQVEARAAVERTASGNEAVDIAAEIAAEIEKLDGPVSTELADATGKQGAFAQTNGADTDTAQSNGAETGGAETEVAETEVATALADVDTLFARLRAGHDEATAAVEHVTTTEPAEPSAVDSAASPASAVSGPMPAASAEPAESGVARSTAQEWRARRAKAIEPLLAGLLKRAKRRAQDDQNALLDSVRRHKGRPTAQQVLGDSVASRDAWAAVLREALDRAYGAGRAAAGAETGPASDAFAGDAADAVVAPLRERLTAAIDSVEEGDTGGLVERIGARYREWKNQSLERTLSETLASAWTRGVYDAVPDQAVLWWVPFEEGRCSDCDDNALEPTVKGEHFPTGQAFPPAHPGCKCLLAPAGLLEGK